MGWRARSYLGDEDAVTLGFSADSSLVTPRDKNVYLIHRIKSLTSSLHRILRSGSIPLQAI